MMEKVFGTAGVRGIFNKSLMPNQIYKLTEATAFVFGRGLYCVGWDGRKTSELLARVVMAAVSAAGSDTKVFGVVPTPVLAYGTRERDCARGFAVTASHNPQEFSGIKIFEEDGMELSRSEEEKIERALVIESRKSSKALGKVWYDSEILSEYKRALVTRYDPIPNGLKIAIDCGSGPGGQVTPYVLKMLGHKVVPVNAQISWRFPARQPEPTRENLAEFARMVATLGVDFGFAHDGDADRLVMVNSAGNLVPDSVCSVLALRGLKRSSGMVLLSENTSFAVEEEAIRLGFRVSRTKVGKTFSLLKEDGVFASEPSKITDPSWGLWEDGMNAAVLIANTVAEDRGLLEMLKDNLGWYYRQVNLNGIINMSDLVVKMRDSFKKFRVEEESMLDGYKIVFNDHSWIMFRLSGTESKIRIYCESRSSDGLESLLEEEMKCVSTLVHN